MWYSVMPTTLTIEKKLGRSLSKTRSVTPEDIVVRRSTEKQKQKLIHLLGQPDDDSQGCKVISVWGMGGIGKTTLVRSVYQSQQLCGWKRAWATASRLFNSDALLWNLAMQLQTNIEEKDSTRADTVKQKKDIREMGHQEMTSELSKLLGTQNCLIVLDDLSTTEEWDSIKSILLKSKRVIVTTREKSVAEHCCEDEHNIYKLVGIEDDAALDLFKTKVLIYLLIPPSLLNSNPYNILLETECLKAHAYECLFKIGKIGFDFIQDWLTWFAFGHVILLILIRNSYGTSRLILTLHARKNINS